MAQATWQVWNDIIEKSQTTGAAALTAPERIVLLVNNFLIDFENGALSGFLYNASPTASHGSDWSVLRDTTEALVCIGEGEVAALVQRAHTAVQATPNLGPTTWSEFLATLRPVGVVEQLHNEISHLIPGVWQSLCDFTASHFGTEER